MARPQSVRTGVHPRGVGAPPGASRGTTPRGKRRTIGRPPRHTRRRPGTRAERQSRRAGTTPPRVNPGGLRPPPSGAKWDGMPVGARLPARPGREQVPASGPASGAWSSAAAGASGWNLPSRCRPLTTPLRPPPPQARRPVQPPREPVAVRHPLAVRPRPLPDIREQRLGSGPRARRHDAALRRPAPVGVLGPRLRRGGHDDEQAADPLGTARGGASSGSAARWASMTDSGSPCDMAHKLAAGITGVPPSWGIAPATRRWTPRTPMNDGAPPGALPRGRHAPAPFVEPGDKTPTRRRSRAAVSAPAPPGARPGPASAPRRGGGVAPSPWRRRRGSRGEFPSPARSRGAANGARGARKNQIKEFSDFFFHRYLDT